MNKLSKKRKKRNFRKKLFTSEASRSYLFGAGSKKRTNGQLKGLVEIRLPRPDYSTTRFLH